MQAARIILLPLYARYLSPGEFGTLEILNRIGDVFNICLMVNGIRSAALTFYCQAKTRQQQETAVATVTLFLIVVLVAAGLGGLIFARPLARLLGVASPTLLMFGIVAALLDATTVLPLALMQARVESLRFASFSLAMVLVAVSLIIFAVAGLGWGIWGILGGYAFTSAVFGGSLTAWELRRGSLRPDWAMFRDVVRYTWPFVPTGVCMFVLHSADRFFLLRYSGVDDVGVYALGYKLAFVVGMVSVYPLLQVWKARMYAAFELPNAAVIVARVVTWMLAAYLFAGMGLWMFQEEIIAIVGGAGRYAEATQVIGLILLAYYFATAQGLFDSPLYVFRRTGLKPWITLAAALFTVALLAVLVPQWAAKGAACALLGGLCFFALLTLVISQRVFHVRYEFLRLAVMLLTAIGLVLVAQRLGSGPFAVLEKMGLWATWPALLWLTGVVRADEKRQAWDVLGSAYRWLLSPFGRGVTWPGRGPSVPVSSLIRAPAESQASSDAIDVLAKPEGNE